MPSRPSHEREGQFRPQTTSSQMSGLSPQFLPLDELDPIIIGPDGLPSKLLIPSAKPANRRLIEPNH